MQPNISKKLGIVFCQISSENCFRKADISIQYFNDIDPFEETSIEEQMVKLIDGISDVNVNDMTEFIHVDNPTSKEFTEAIMDDINDVVDMANNNHCLEEEIEDEVEKQDDAINLSNNSMTICRFEQLFVMIAALGADILHSSLASKSHGHYGNLTAA
jgi:hypothetical protein